MSRFPHLIRSFLAIARLRLQNFDIALNLHQLHSPRGTQRMKLLFRLIGAKETYGRNTAGRGSFYTKSLPDPESPESVHEVEMNLRVVRLLGIDAPLAQPKFWLLDSDREAAARLLPQSWRDDGKPVVALCPGAEVPNKRWRAERYTAVGLELARRFGARIVVVGGAADSMLLAWLSPILESGGISLIGQTSLPVLAGVLENCRLLVTNDSGPMHLAAAMRTPVVAIFGPGYPGRFGPVGEGHIVLHHQVECSPCNDFHCRRMLCLDSISTDDVLAAASQLLQKTTLNAMRG
jgi:ADP-heptose:LPS heptosyltransferase